MKIIMVNDQYVLVDVPFESHRRGKNYACLITGLDEKFDFRREFLARTKTSTGPGYVFSSKPAAGQIVQIAAIYYSCSGHPSPQKGSGMYEIQCDGSLIVAEIFNVRKSFESVSESVSL